MAAPTAADGRGIHAAVASKVRNTHDQPRIIIYREWPDGASTLRRVPFENGLPFVLPSVVYVIGCSVFPSVSDSRRTVVDADVAERIVATPNRGYSEMGQAWYAAVPMATRCGGTMTIWVWQVHLSVHQSILYMIHSVCMCACTCVHACAGMCVCVCVCV